MYSSGFTLLETIVAIGILSVGIIGGVVLMTTAVGSISGERLRLTAVFLAEEGVELSRNLRDQNWLKFPGDSNKWTDGFFACGASACTWRMHYLSERLLLPGAIPLAISPAGFYGYNGEDGFAEGTATNFSRDISFASVSGNEVKVDVLVKWQDRGSPREYRVEEHLYNWR
ncbi:prepilin-type N-terminal cleavage/methylation domain-containing protein [Candidatus Azambacteria bacterium]|nr:prepilin-type N-terminal cleavage/methylation domain-containing protein [Candidatus Azambacteria bacterium]